MLAVWRSTKPLIASLFPITDTYKKNVYTVIPRSMRFPIARIRITGFFDLVQKNLHYAIL